MKVNKLSLKQTGGQPQPQAQAIDPAIQQITEFITSSLDEGQEPVGIVMSLAEQEVDQQIIAQAFMTMGYEEADVMGLFEEVQKQLQPPGPSSPEQQTQNPQEIARNESLIAEAQQAEAQQKQEAVAQQDAMAQQLQAKSGIEIKPENKGKFTNWAKSRGMSVSEAANRVMNDTESYSPSIVKMANFAKNAAGWKKEEGGEFTPHWMYDGGNTKQVETYAEHLKLKDMGYSHENNMTKADDGIEQGSVKGNTNNVVRKRDRFTYAPNYVNPIAFNSNNGASILDGINILAGGYNTFFDKTEDANGIKKGTFMDWNKKQSLIPTKKNGQFEPGMTSKYGGSLDRAKDGYFSKGMDYLQTGLSAAGLTPGFGIIPDAVNTAISGTRAAYSGITGDTKSAKKHLKSATLNAGSMIPVVGQGFGTASLANDAAGYAGFYDKEINAPTITTNNNTIDPNKAKYGQEVMQYLKNGGSLPKAQFMGEWKPDQWGVDEFGENIGGFQPGPAPQATMGPEGPPAYDNVYAPDQTNNNPPNFFKKFMDSREVDAFGDVSNFAVQGAGFLNNWLERGNVNDAIADNRNNLIADSIYGVNENPFNKNGNWDVNTGTFGSEGQRTVSTNWGMAKSGKEIGSETIDVDSTLLAKLIAAGADIEIL